MTKKAYYDLEDEAASAVQNLDQVDEDDEQTFNDIFYV